MAEDENKNGDGNGKNQENKLFCNILFSFSDTQIPREVAINLANTLVGFFVFFGFLKEDGKTQVRLLTASVGDGDLLSITFSIPCISPDSPSPESSSDNQPDNQKPPEPPAENPDKPFKVSDYLGGDDDDPAS